MRTSRHAWWLAGLVAGLAGLATSYFVAMVMTIRESPVVAVAELVIRLTPGAVAERAIQVLGHHDKPFLVVVHPRRPAALLFAWAGGWPGARGGWPSLVLARARGRSAASRSRCSAAPASATCCRSSSAS